MIVWSLLGWPRASFSCWDPWIMGFQLSKQESVGTVGRRYTWQKRNCKFVLDSCACDNSSQFCISVCVYSHTPQIVTDEAAHEPHAAPDAWLGFLHNSPISLWFKLYRPICHKHRRWCGVPVSESHQWKRINALAADSSVSVQRAWTVVLGFVGGK